MNNVAQNDEVEGRRFATGNRLYGFLAERNGGSIPAEKPPSFWADIDSSYGSCWIGLYNSLRHGALAAADLQYPVRPRNPRTHKISEAIEIDKESPIELRHPMLAGAEHSPDYWAGRHNGLTFL